MFIQVSDESTGIWWGQGNSPSTRGLLDGAWMFAVKTFCSRHTMLVRNREISLLIEKAMGHPKRLWRYFLERSSVRFLSIWLLELCDFVLFMILIGGITK